MSDEEIEAMARQLEASARLEEVRFRIVHHGGDIDENYIAANRFGYLRFSALMLRAAIAPYQEDSADKLVLDENGVIDDFSDIFIDWFERREDLWQNVQEQPEVEEKSDRLFLFGCALFCFILVFVFIMGLAAIFGLIDR